VTAYIAYAPPLSPVTAETLKGVRWSAECARLMAAKCPDDALGAIRRSTYKMVAEALFAAADEYEHTVSVQGGDDGGREVHGAGDPRFD
jgi:predicted TPR repeat methyltransferase